MCVAGDGTFEGSVSGGCVETAVVEAAGEVIESGRPRLLEFGVTNDLAWEVGLACGGSIEVWVQPAPSPPLLSRMVEARRRQGGGVLATDLASGESWWVEEGRRPEQPDGNVTGASIHPIPPPLRLQDLCREALSTGTSCAAEIEGRRIFLDVVQPPRRIVVVGAVHIAQALVPMAEAAGFETVVVDPRGLFATEERFPGVKVVHAWPIAAFDQLTIDRQTAVVALSHDPKFDDPAVSAALEAGAGYVGALGSTRSHAKRVARLTESGIDEALIGRIRAPIGLDLGGRSPGEIATAILAEIVQDFSGFDSN